MQTPFYTTAHRRRGYIELRVTCQLDSDSRPWQERYMRFTAPNYLCHFDFFFFNKSLRQLYFLELTQRHNQVYKQIAYYIIVNKNVCGVREINPRNYGTLGEKKNVLDCIFVLLCCGENTRCCSNK